VANDNLVFIGEFQPHSDEFNPIRGDEIMESFIFQHSLDSISNVKKFHIGQVTQSADELIEEMNVTLVRHIRSVSFSAKPWRYTWNEDKSKEKEFQHSFVISILQPYSHPAHDGSCCLKVIEQFQSTLFQISSQRRGKSMKLMNTETVTVVKGSPSIVDDIGVGDYDDGGNKQDDLPQPHLSQLLQQQQQQQQFHKIQLQKQRRQRQRRQQQILEQRFQQQLQQELQQQQLLQQEQQAVSIQPTIPVSNLQSSSINLTNISSMTSTGTSTISDKKSLKFCHSFSDGHNSSSNCIIDNSFDENVFDNLELLKNVSFRMLRHSDSAGDILSDPLFPLVENVDYMDVSDEDDVNNAVDDDDIDGCIEDEYDDIMG